MGGSRLIAWDFSGPDVENDEVREMIRLKRRAILDFCLRVPCMLTRRRRVVSGSHSSLDLEKDEQEFEEKMSSADIELGTGMNTLTQRHSVVGAETQDDVASAVTAAELSPRTPSEACSVVPADKLTSTVASSAVTMIQVEPVSPVEQQDPSGDSCSKSVRFVEALEEPTPDPHPRRTRIKTTIRNFLIQLSTPPSMSIIVSFVISLINPIKALFVEVPKFHIASAPDGQPPLAFIMDTATFVGAASVPLGLICLGSALARLKVPTSVGAWKALPVGAISSFAVAKIVLSPVLGVLICQGLTNAGVIDKDDKVLRFVCM